MVKKLKKLKNRTIASGIEATRFSSISKNWVTTANHAISAEYAGKTSSPIKLDLLGYWKRCF